MVLVTLITVIPSTFESADRTLPPQTFPHVSPERLRLTCSACAFNRLVGGLLLAVAPHEGRITALSAENPPARSTVVTLFIMSIGWLEIEAKTNSQF